jgi:alpha-glucosidase
MGTIERLLKGISLFGVLTSMQIVLTPLRNAYHTVRFAAPRRRGPALWLATWRALTRQPSPVPLSDFTQSGSVRSHTVSGQTVAVACNNATIHVTVLAGDLVRVQVQRAGEALDTFSYAIARPDEAWPGAPFSVRDGETLDIETSALTCRVNKGSGRIAFLDRPGGREITHSAWGPGWRGAEVACSLSLADGERIYGLGENAFGLDRRGRIYTMWNDDPNGAYPPGHDPLYLSFPFYMGVSGAAAYGVFFDNTYRSTVDAGASQPDRLTLRAEGGPLRCYVFAGPTATDVLERYTELTGRLRLPPLWAIGYHQSRWSYTPDSRVRQIAGQMRAHRIPCDAIHLDIHYMDGYRCFTWRPERFPDPARLVGDLHAQGFKVVTLIDCGIKRDRSYSVCTDGLAEKAFCAYPDGSLFHGPVWPGDCYFPDFTSPRVRSWWGRQNKALTDIGVDGVWNDMNEPTVFGPVAGTMPDTVQHDWDGRGATHAQAHNVYGLLMARASAEGLAALPPYPPTLGEASPYPPTLGEASPGPPALGEASPFPPTLGEQTPVSPRGSETGQPPQNWGAGGLRRPFVLTRSGWAGLQRYAMNWMGDNISTWEHLRLTMPMIANLGISGLAFTGPDTGGFAQDCTPELLTRWLQLGVFTPFLRNHTSLGTADQEPWAHGEPYTSLNRRSIELRYHLLPYIYTAFWQCSQTGLPMLRPLFLIWPDDAQTYRLDDQFMFGDALLVAPVTELEATRRNVYLPAGVWYDWWSGRRYDGGQTITVAAPLDCLPLFARAGSIVPAWPVMQYVGEKPVDVLTLYVFAGNGESMLYEDDGASTAYERGDMRITRLVQRSTAEGLTIERRYEGTYTPGYTTVELIVRGLETGATYSVGADSKPVGDTAIADDSGAARGLAPLAANYQIRQQD